MEVRTKTAGFSTVKFVDAISAADKEVDFYAQNNNPWHSDRQQWLRDLACFASHLKAIRTFLDSGSEMALICEDDILFHNSFASLADTLITGAYQSAKQIVNLISFTYMISGGVDQTYAVEIVDRAPEPGVVWKDLTGPPVRYGLWKIDKKVTWGAQCYYIHRGWAERVYKLLHRPVTEKITSEAIIQRSGGYMASVPLVVEDNIGSDRAPQDIPFHLRHFSRWTYANYIGSDPDGQSPLAKMKPSDSYPGYPFKL